MQQSDINKYSRRAVIVIALAALFLFYKYILQISPSVMVHELMAAFSLNGAELGFMAACYFYTYIIFQVPAGILLDRFGLRVPLTLAISITALGAVALSQTQTVFIAYIARALIGVGAAFATTGYMKAVNNWVPRKHLAIFTGLFGTACNLGATFATMPVAILVTHYGWRQSLLYIAILGCVLTVCIAFFVRNAPLGCQTQQSLLKRHFLQALKSVVLLRNNWPLLVFNGAAYAPIAIYGGLWGVPFLEARYHISRVDAAFSASLIFLGIAIGGPILGWASDRFHNRKQLIYMGTLLSLVSLLALIYLPNLNIVEVDWLTFITGFGLSSFLISYTMTFESNAPENMATAIAVVNTGAPIFGAIAEPLIGHLLDNGWNAKVDVHGAHIFSVTDYHQALTILPTYLIIALIAMWFVKDENQVNVINANVLT